MTTSTLSVRLERIVPGTPANYGHDLVLFGLFRDGRFWTASRNRSASEIMAHGMTCPQADAVLDMVEETNSAFDIRNGLTVLL